MSAPRVTPLSPRRGKGRPNRQAALTIAAERSRFKAKQKLIDLEEKAVDELKNILDEKEIPAQVKLGAIKETLRLCDELYYSLVEAEQEFDAEEDNTKETISQEENQDLSSVIDWGEFGNMKQS